jgi:hypothetical protein
MILAPLATSAPFAFRHYVTWLNALEPSLKARAERELLYDFFETQHILLNVVGIFDGGLPEYGYNLQFRYLTQDAITRHFPSRWQAEEAGLREAFTRLEQRLTPLRPA